MDVLLTVVGIVAIVVGLVDMFHTLLHPSGQGRVSQVVFSVVWKISKIAKHPLGSAVGPLAMVLVIVLWVALQGVGWALIFYPHIPDGFMYSSGVNSADYPNFIEALYLSLVTLTTVGYGDVVATDPWVRAASPIEALTGFALLTAALTWFTQIYPPLSRRRALALELKGLADTAYADSIGEVDAVTLSRLLDTIAGEVAKVRVDFTQHSEGFYFQEQSPELALARQLPYALRLRDAALSRQEVAVRLSAQQLSLALDELAAKLTGFLHTGEDCSEIFEAYARDHGQDPRT